MKTNYGNWISTPMMKTFAAITAALYVLTILYAVIYDRVSAPFFILAILSGIATVVTLYMSYCRHVFSFEGGGLMRHIHTYLLDQLPWDGTGRVLEVRCGSGVISNFVFHEVRTQKDKFKLVEEALRVLKKGGAFALHDTYGNKDMYGNMDEFVAYLKEKGIADVSYIPNTERNIPMPAPVRFMLRGIGILYGTK